MPLLRSLLFSCLFFFALQRAVFRLMTKKLAKIKAKYNTMQAVDVVVVGAGPVGLRTAIELALCGAHVTLLEKRDKFTRPHILQLWDCICSDLINLGINSSEINGQHFMHMATSRMQVGSLK